MKKESKFKVGDKAYKPKGYAFPCTIVGVFETLKGEIRVVGEMDKYGLLHIFNEGQLEHVEVKKCMNNEKYAVYEREPAHGLTKNGFILGPFNSKEEAQSNGEKYGYTGDNYYVNSMNNEKYNQIIDEAYRKYADSHEYFVNGWLHVIPMSHNKETFITEIKTNPSFSEKWGLKIEERDLSLEERYNIWFNNNYETGMERYFDPNNLPDFDNEYYEPTPTKLITVTYNDIKTEIYE